MEIWLVISIHALGCTSKIWKKWDGCWAKCKFAQNVQFGFLNITQKWWHIIVADVWKYQKFRATLHPLGPNVRVIYLNNGRSNKQTRLSYEVDSIIMRYSITLLIGHCYKLLPKFHQNICKTVNQILWCKVFKFQNEDANNIIKIFVASAIEGLLYIWIDSTWTTSMASTFKSDLKSTIEVGKFF